jgi:hypothetical protein
MVFRNLAKRRSSAVLALAAAGVAISCASLGASAASAAVTGSGPRLAAPAGVAHPYRVAVPSGYVHTANRAAVSSTSNAANTIPVYYITSTNYGYLTGIHACLALGNDGTNQGVECEDVYAYAPSSGTVAVFPVAEGICQNLANKSDYPQCRTNGIDFALATGIGYNTPTSTGVCGTYSTSPCVDNGRNYYLGTGIQLSGCDTTPGDINEVWSVNWNGSAIALPSSRVVLSKANAASPHAIICS